MIITSKKLGPEAGMTLIELMLACGVVAMALALLLGSLTSFTNVGTIAADRSQATVLLAGTLEQLRLQSYTTLLAYTPPTLSTGPGASRAITLSCYNAAGSAVALPIVGAAPANLPNPLEVRAQLVWQDKRGQAYSATMSAMLGR